MKENFPKSERASFKDIWKAFWSVFPALTIPGIILIGIFSGAFTATESAAIAVLIALVVGFFVYRELNLKDLPKMLLSTALNTAIVTFIFAMSDLFSWILAFERVPNEMAEFMISISENPIVFLLILNIFLFLIGIPFEGIPAMIILVPILLPVAENFGIDPIHLGIIISINLTIGLITPPVGTALFLALSIGGLRMETLTRALIPFIIVAYLVLLIITYIPQITLLIPNLFG